MLAELVDSLKDPVLGRMMVELDQVLDGVDSKAAWFPAFAVVVEPSLVAPAVSAQPAKETNATRAYACVLSLLTLERQGAPIGNRRCTEKASRAKRQAFPAIYGDEMNIPCHAIPRVFGYMQHRASHGKTESVRRKWARAEIALVKRYCPILWTMVRLGIKKERL